MATTNNTTTTNTSISFVKGVKKGPRFVCVKCGTKHSLHACPNCKSDEYTHNK